MFLDIIKKGKDVMMEKYFKSEDYINSWESYIIHLKDRLAIKINNKKGVFTSITSKKQEQPNKNP